MGGNYVHIKLCDLYKLMYIYFIYIHMYIGWSMHLITYVNNCFNYHNIRLLGYFGLCKWTGHFW